MELGVFSSCIAGENYADRFAELARIGYDFLEVSTKEEFIDGLPGSGDEVRAASEEAGIPVRSANLGTFPSFFEACADPEAREKAFHRQDLVCDFISVWGPGAVLLLPVWEGEGGDAVEKAYLDNLTEAADRAAARSVKLALEHIGSSKFRAKGAEIRDLAKAVGHRNLGLYFDIGNSRSAGEDPVKVLEGCGEELFQIHLKGTRDVPFKDMPLGDAASLLGAMGYSGRGAVEIPARHDNNDHLVEALELIKGAGFP